MSATHRLYVDRTGAPGEPPRWRDLVEHQEAIGLAQGCALVAERNSKADRHERAARWALSSILWRYRAAWLREHELTAAFGQGRSAMFTRHTRESRAARSRASAVARFHHENPRQEATP